VRVVCHVAKVEVTTGPLAGPVTLAPSVRPPITLASVADSGGRVAGRLGIFWKFFCFSDGHVGGHLACSCSHSDFNAGQKHSIGYLALRLRALAPGSLRPTLFRGNNIPDFQGTVRIATRQPCAIGRKRYPRNAANMFYALGHLRTGSAIQ
jgi:hypothetical protein